MSKTPEELARDWSRERTMQPCANGYNMWIMDEWRLAEEAFIAGYQAAKEINSSNNSNGWISVKDRLPEFCEDVLVRGECGIIDQGHRIKWSHSDEWVWRAGNYSGCAEEVTHWMPLPQPPKEEE
jgi:hypothetical protein